MTLQGVNHYKDKYVYKNRVILYGEMDMNKKWVLSRILVWILFIAF